MSEEIQKQLLELEITKEERRKKFRIIRYIGLFIIAVFLIVLAVWFFM